MNNLQVYSDLPGHSSIPELIRCQCAQLDHAYHPGAWGLEGWRECSRYWLSTVVLGDKLAAFALFQLVLADRLAHLCKVLTHPNYRHQHLASNLLRHSFEQLALKGLTRIYLEVEGENTAALGLYRHLGFLEVHRQQGYYSSGAVAIKMELVVANDSMG